MINYIWSDTTILHISPSAIRWRSLRTEQGRLGVTYEVGDIDQTDVHHSEPSSGTARLRREGARNEQVPGHPNPNPEQFYDYELLCNETTLRNVFECAQALN